MFREPRREEQQILMDCFCKRLCALSGLEFTKADMSHLPDDILCFEYQRYCNTVKLKFDWDTFDTNNPENTPVELDWYVSMEQSDLSILDMFDLSTAVSQLVKTECAVYFDCGVDEPVENIMKKIKIHTNPSYMFDRKGLVLDKTLATTLDTACKKGTLSVVSVFSMREKDKKYEAFLQSRGAIKVGNSNYIILDNE